MLLIFKSGLIWKNKIGMKKFNVKKLFLKIPWQF